MNLIIHNSEGKSVHKKGGGRGANMERRLTMRKGFLTFQQIAFIDIHFNRRTAITVFASITVISFHITAYP